MTKKLDTAKHKKLSKKEKEFVAELISNGGNLTAAVLSIGYKGKNARAQASYIWRKPSVRAAFSEMLASKLASGRALSLKVFEDVAKSADSDHARISAAKELWDRADKLEGMTQQAGGVSVTINLGGNLSATQPIDVTPESLDNLAQIDTEVDDDTSY